MDVVLLSRLQFALTIMFHYLFPPLTIGMGLVLVYLEGMYLKTSDLRYHQAARFWTRIFALNFAIGVATGIVMEFEFGTNWAVYSRFVGDVFGSALAAEGIFAFFLESGFLAVLVFGWDRVGPRMHFFSTLMVALGSIFSSVWIVVANSWQQTPAGHRYVQMSRDGQPWFIDGQPVMRAEIVDFWALVFNPSSVNRLVHVWIGSFILGSFFIMSISAWYVLKRRHLEFARRSFTGALLLGTLSSLAMLASGHFQARSVAVEQPAKLAAFEGHFRTGKADLSLFGLPNGDEQRVDFDVAIPGGLSFLVHDDFDAPVIGLDRFRPEHRPPLTIPFVSYHLMVALGFSFILLTVTASWMHWRGKLLESRPMMWLFVVAVIGAFAANQAGWVAAEVGRQPWVVHPTIARDTAGEPLLDDDGFVRYRTQTVTMADGTTRERIGGLLTESGVSEVVRAEQVLGSIVMFALLYLMLGSLWLFVLNRKIQTGPEEYDEAGRPGRSAGLLEVAGSKGPLTGTPERS
ncbi:MAG TPA: cytochrome ubiquinol oxidase subunit I [Candidatus Polarisedimenticolaceae bacterium]|nr:cytochrome ubiquinol oxidase subunit I [Candidatus Polarisedimenticolaceae bacterium]